MMDWGAPVGQCRKIGTIPEQKPGNQSPEMKIFGPEVSTILCAGRSPNSTFRSGKIIEGLAKGKHVALHWIHQGIQKKAAPKSTNHHLVGGLEHFSFFHILGIIIPTDELIFFRGVGQPPTSHLPHVFLPQNGESYQFRRNPPSIHGLHRAFFHRPVGATSQRQARHRQIGLFEYRGYPMALFFGTMMTIHCMLGVFSDKPR